MLPADTPVAVAAPEELDAAADEDADEPPCAVLDLCFAADCDPGADADADAEAGPDVMAGDEEAAMEPDELPDDETVTSVTWLGTAGPVER